MTNNCLINLPKLDNGNVFKSGGKVYREGRGIHGGGVGWNSLEKKCRRQKIHPKINLCSKFNIQIGQWESSKLRGKVWGDGGIFRGAEEIEKKNWSVTNAILKWIYVGNLKVSANFDDGGFGLSFVGTMDISKRPRVARKRLTKLVKTKWLLWHLQQPCFVGLQVFWWVGNRCRGRWICYFIYYVLIVRLS